MSYSHQLMMTWAIKMDLQSRGLYPVREERMSYASEKPSLLKRIKNKIRKYI